MPVNPAGTSHSTRSSTRPELNAEGQALPRSDEPLPGVTRSGKIYLSSQAAGLKRREPSRPTDAQQQEAAQEGASRRRIAAQEADVPALSLSKNRRKTGMPAITPQNIGGPIRPAGAIGSWGVAREALPSAIVQNLQLLSSMRSPEAEIHPRATESSQLQNEISMHWHCLSEHEALQVVEALARPGHRATVSTEGTNVDSLQRPPARQWLDVQFNLLSSSKLNKLRANASAEGKVLIDELLLPRAALDRTIATRFKNKTPVDTQFDYAGFLQVNKVIGTLPEAARQKRVAIVGAGAAGLAAAFELLRIGADVTIMEAQGQIGGRLRALSFDHGSGEQTPSRAEMGAMRFPPSGAIFKHYIQQFGVPTQKDFPNPGKVPTQLYFKGEVINWPAGEEPQHSLLKSVKQDFARMMGAFLEPITNARNANDVEGMREIWQGHVDKFKDLTFQQGTQALVRESGLNWGKEHFDALDALGVGTGGFGPLNQIAFLEILRVQVDELETDQELLPKGTTHALEQFLNTEVTLPDGKTRSLATMEGALQLNTNVVNVVPTDSGGVALMLKQGDETRTEEFAAVIFTGNPRSAVHSKMALTQLDQRPVFGAEVEQALKKTHLVNSSKIFVQVDTQFWLDAQGNSRPDIPQVIQSDGPLHGLYCLAYEGSKRGVMLASYTWEDKSTNFAALEPRERLALIKDEVARINPEVAAHIKPDAQIHCIDWQNEKFQYGAFKLDQVGQATGTQDLYAQFKEDSINGVILAGDAVSYQGGWVAGALRTGINAACAVVEKLGGELSANGPLEQDTRLFNYK